MDHDHHRQRGPQGYWRSRHALGLVVIGGIAGYFLLEERRAHVLGAFSYLVLLACPLMHFFMHRGHGNHKSHHHTPDQSEGDAADRNSNSKPGDRP